MKCFPALFIFLFCVVSVNAQKGRIMKCNYETNGQWSETYYVLKSDSSVKDGKYQRWVGDEKVMQGSYKNNEKNGRWTFYLGGVVIAEGNYSHNLPVQAWKFYSTYHDLIQVYDFERDSLLFFDKQLEESFYPSIALEGDQGKTQPMFVGGQTFLNYMLKYNVRYPEIAAGLKKQGTVNVEFSIDTNGVVKEPLIEEKIGFGMDEEAIRFVNQLDKFWIPGKLNGQKIMMRYTLPVSFVYRKY
jgi:TonB family protein